MKHSELKQQFDTGAQRDTQSGKPRFDLISPFALRRLAIVCAKGAEHYGDRNWEKGIPLSRMTASLMRHVMAFAAGEVDEDHLAQAMWNAAGIMHFQEMIARGLQPDTLDDLPKYQTQQQARELPTSVEQSPDYADLIALGCPDRVASQIVAGITYRENSTRYAYLAGPMRGHKEFNFPAFDRARNILNQRGWNVISPADMCRDEALKRDPSKEDSDQQLQYAIRDFWSLAFIRSKTKCQHDGQYRETAPVEHAIALLPGWWHSTGATAEAGIAKWLGLSMLAAETGAEIQK
jgi:hypothetical protein